MAQVVFLRGDARALPLPDGAAALVVTSPPYWNARAYSTWPTYGAYLADMARAWAECYRVLCDGGRICVNVADGYGRPATGGYLPIGDDTARALQAAGFTLRGKVIWDKTPAGLGTAWGSWLSASNPSLRDCHEVIITAHKGAAGRGPGADTIDRATFLSATASIWHIRPARATWHPAPFPPEIPRRLIHLHSYAGDLVCDPFCGTGTTVIEAARAGRRGLGVDACAEYILRAASYDKRELETDRAQGSGGPGRPAHGAGPGSGRRARGRRGLAVL